MRENNFHVPAIFPGNSEGLCHGIRASISFFDYWATPFDPFIRLTLLLMHFGQVRSLMTLGS